MDLIFKTTSYLEDNSIYKITTEEYCNLDLKEIIWNINMIIFDRFTSHNIHLSDENKMFDENKRTYENKGTYRIDNTVTTLNQLKEFIRLEESKYDFLNKVKYEIINSNQQTFDFDKNNNNCTTLEYEIPNKWLSHHKCYRTDNSYKIIININF